MNTKEWEIELEKLDLCECERNDTGKFQTELIKDFIKSLLSSHTQEIRELLLEGLQNEFVDISTIKLVDTIYDEITKN